MGKMLTEFQIRNGNFISKNGNSLFTFARHCVNMYAVKIGKSVDFSRKYTQNPGENPLRFVFFNDKLILTDCLSTGKSSGQNIRTNR